MDESLIHTPEHGWKPKSIIKAVKCPRCRIVFNGLLSGDESKIFIPGHGKTIEMNCLGGNKWYNRTVPDQPTQPHPRS